MFYYLYVVAVHCKYYQFHPWNAQYFTKLDEKGIKSVTWHVHSYSGVCFYRLGDILKIGYIAAFVAMPLTGSGRPLISSTKQAIFHQPK